MKLMRRKRDGRVAVFDARIVADGDWELFEEAPAPQPEPPAPEPKPEPAKPKAPQIPRSLRPVKPLVRETDPEQVTALFEPPVIQETQTAKMTPADKAEDVQSE